jgi:hypothetical protein
MVMMAGDLGGGWLLRGLSHGCSKLDPFSIHKKQQNTLLLLLLLMCLISVSPLAKVRAV